jgi:hypothetical protein
MQRLLLSAMLLIAVPHILPGQAKLSEKATTTQVVNGTTFTIEYYRPVVRGRTELFGKQVHWGEIWTPGANWATTFEFDRDVILNGHLIPKGKYSVWMITSRDSAWTFFLNKTARRFHTNRPKDTTEDIVRFPVQPTTGPAMEALLWYFPSIQRDTATLHMHWATTVVPLRMVTTPLPRLVLTAAQRKALVGDYDIERLIPKGTSASRISEEGDKLFYTVSLGTPNESKSELVAVGDNRFRRIQKVNGKEELADIEYLFKHEADGSVTFDAIMPESKELVARGKRKL